MRPDGPEGEGLRQSRRIAADPGIALGRAKERIGLGDRGQCLDIDPGLDQAVPADLTVKHVERVLAGLVGIGERAQRVAEHAQQPTRLLAIIQMPLLLPGLGLGEQASNQPTEHGERGIGQLAAQLDQLRCDQCAPAPGIEVVGQPARRHRALAHQLGPAFRMDACAALRVKLERPHDAQPFEVGKQVLLARHLRQSPQPGEAGLPDGGIDGEQPVERGQPLGRETVEQRRFHPPPCDDPCDAADPVERVGGRKQRLALPECGDGRLGDRLALVGRGGCGDRCQKCGAPVLATGRLQSEMPLCLDRVLAPARVTPSILGQCTGVDADLLGNEGDHRCRERLTRKDRPTEMA